MIADRLPRLANFYLVYCRDPVRIKYGQHDYTIIDLSPPAGAAGGRWVSGQGKLGWAAPGAVSWGPRPRCCWHTAANTQTLVPGWSGAAHVTQHTQQDGCEEEDGGAVSRTSVLQ